MIDLSTVNEPEGLPERCDPRIFSEGDSVAVLPPIGRWKIEAWVREVARISGQPVDWHFVGGWANVKALGDLDRVRAAIKELMPAYEAFEIPEKARHSA